MKKVLIAVLCIVLSVALVGCGSSDPLVGTWKASDEFKQMMGSMISALGGDASTAPESKLQLRADGTYKMTTGTDSTEGEYKYENDKLYLTTDGNTSDSGLTLSEDGKSLLYEGTPMYEK